MSLTKVSYSMIEGAAANVLDFGATGDGVTDDRAAIQAAIDHVAAQGGGTVYFPKPAAHYRITSKHPVEDCGLLIESSNIKLQGNWISDNHEAAHIRCFFASSTLAGLYVKGLRRGLVFDGFSIFTDFATNAGYFEITPNLTMRQCRFTCNSTTANIAAGRAASNGLYIGQTFVSILEGVWATGIIGFNIGDLGECTSTTFSSCYANRCRDIGYKLFKVQYSTLNSCACDGGDAPWNHDLLTAYDFPECQGITMNACGAEEGRTALRMTPGCLQMTINGLWVTGYGAKTAGEAAPLIQWNGSGSIQGFRYFLLGTRFYPERPFRFSSFDLPGQRIAVLDPSIQRSLITNLTEPAGSTKNLNLFVIDDTPQLRTYQFAAAGGTVLTIPIISQNSQWVKHSLHIRGCTQDGANSNPRPFESTIGFRSLTSLADITSNNAYGITSVTASGMDLVVTLANAVDGIIVSINPMYRDRQNCVREELIDFNNITFS